MKNVTKIINYVSECSRIYIFLFYPEIHIGLELMPSLGKPKFNQALVKQENKLISEEQQLLYNKN